MTEVDRMTDMKRMMEVTMMMEVGEMTDVWRLIAVERLVVAVWVTLVEWKWLGHTQKRGNSNIKPWFSAGQHGQQPYFQQGHPLLFPEKIP